MTCKLTRVLCALVALLIATAACAAETQRVDQTEYIPKDDSTHQKVVDTWEYQVDEDGEYGSGRPLDGSATIETHVFDQYDKCNFCGYVKGTGAKAEGAGDSAAESLDIADVLLRAAGQYADRRAEIANAADIFSADEAEQLARLPIREQVLVLLAAIGRERDEALSADAQALLDAIRARADKDALLEGFPGETLTLNGEAVDCVVVEIAFDADGGRALERYAFRRDSLALAQVSQAR